ncbi:hypothetical protein GK047_24770 [Paenibacillus sp. SYP-B3998]|uniref:DUF5050 domain-containing protein n=1 Tax=Paenibacillus sp. SYP-B3998 TaxID=2678564 RepID=A0A6G4A4D4_9BACL|nr:hypothetical protein [Paenibacillus sp. SYP-B3998]NEW09190.1 hypothetical protein [Paenibacillus sp. SYP-B3998]
MRKNKIKAAATAVLGVALMFGLLVADSHSAEAARSSNTVDVQLPTFRVMMNNYNPIPQNESYPPIVYNDVTYIAMTWNNCQRLNLSIDWNGQTGLTIAPKTVGAPMYPNEAQAEHDNDIHATYEATIADYPITVNGKSIDNSKETYPILSFREITYFPLTWRFTHDEFQWMTDWSDTDGFTVLTGNKVFGISSITADMGNDLYIHTNVYGTLKLNKSLQGNVEAAAADSVDQARQHRTVGNVRSDPDAKHNQTRLDNGRLMLGDIELIVPDRTADVKPEDTVISAGSFRLVSVSLSSRDRNIADVYVVTGNRAELLDRNQPLYRKFANLDGSFWITTAAVSYDVHHTSWLEQHVWLIGKDGNIVSMNKQLGSNYLRILSVLSDGTLLVAASGDASDEQSPADIYRIGSDGKAVKMYESVKGGIYEDDSGEVYVLAYADNQITKLSSGKSVVLNEITMFQAAKGRPQPLNGD